MLTTRRRRAWGCAAVGVATLLIGCTGDDAAELPDACTLLTAEEVTAATGIGFGAGEPDTEHSSEARSICYWQPVDDIHPVLMVSVNDGPSPADEFQMELKETLRETTAIDGATSAWVDASGGVVHMIVDDRYVELNYGWYTGDPTEAVTAVAEVVAGHL